MSKKTYRIRGLHFNKQSKLEYKPGEIGKHLAYHGNTVAIGVWAEDEEKIKEVIAYAESKNYVYNPRDIITIETEETYQMLILPRLADYKSLFR